MNPRCATTEIKEPDLKVVPSNTGPESEPESWGRTKALRIQLWCEWYAHSKLLLVFVAAWLAAVWVLPLYGNPAWILVFGAVFAVWAGPAFGGSDTIEGCEEFTFSLPPTRRERYAARLIIGGGALLLFTAMDLLALGLDLPQILAKLYVAAGLLRPRPFLKTGLLYGLVVTLPLAVFAVSFALSAITHSRRLVLSASLWAALAALSALRLGLWYEDFVWGNPNGYFTCPLLAVLAVTSLWAGARAYACKEIGPQSTPITLPAKWWLWTVLFFVGLLLGLTLASSLLRWCVEKKLFF